jgi:hypothetical protein
MTTRHPGESQGFLSRVAPCAGNEPPRFLGEATDGVAVLGPAVARRPVMRRLAAEAIAAGTSVTVLSLGPESGLADAIAAEAANAPGGVAVVDLDARPELTHRLDPFGDVDAAGLSRLLLAASATLSGGDPEAARARMLVDALAGALVALRDQGLVDISGRLIFNHLDVRKLIDLSDPDMYPQLAGGIRERFVRYLDGLPGYREERKYKQVQSVLDQHAGAVRVAVDAVLPFMDARGWAVSASSVADAALSDIGASGRHVVLRAGNVPGAEFAPAFLAACVEEGLRLRTDGCPALVILDGVDCLPVPQLRRIPGLLGSGVSLAVGFADLRTDALLALSLELGARLVLPAAGRVGLDPLRPSEAERAVHDACISGWNGLLFRDGGTRAVDLPRDARPPRREAVPARSRSTSRHVPDPALEAGKSVVMTRLLDPDVVRPAAETTGEDPVADALARAFAERPSGSSLEDAARAALDGIALLGIPDGRS